MHPNTNAVDDGTGLVLETLPTGDVAWLRPDVREDRFDITEAGRRALAMTHLEKGPSVADVAGLALCPACHRLQSSPGCAQREHWGVS